MIRILKFIGIWLVLLVFISCDDDIPVFTNSPSIPVVYCILDPMDSVYRVQLTKTFYGRSSVDALAKDTDMVVLKNAGITLEAWSQGYCFWKTRFHRDSFGRDSGLFTDQPGCAFSTTDVFVNDYGYRVVDSLVDYFRLVVDYGESLEPAISRIRATSYKPGIEYPKNNAKSFSLYDSIPFYVEFNSSERIYYDLRFTVTFEEFSTSWQKRIHEFSYRCNIPVRTGKFRQEILPDQFFRRLAQSFPASNGISKRQLVSIDLGLYAGSSTLKTYVETYHSDNAHSHELWNCFNNGIGLFALKSHTSIMDLRIEQRTLDSLAHGRHTQALMFSSWRLNLALY